MADIVDRATRSRMMAGIRGRDTKPEMEIRRALHRQGFRFRLHARHLPGRPDIVLPKYKAVVLVHGCFWHGHDCKYFRLPASRREFWRDKILNNRERDGRQLEQLRTLGWRVMVVWECAFRGRTPKQRIRVIAQAIAWLRSGRPYMEVRG